MMSVSEQFDLIADARRSVPVNVFTLARNLGLGCHPAHLGPDISGMLERAADGRYRLYYNENDSETRQRFTVAHEIAHFILHKSRLGNGVDDDRFYRSTLQGKHKNVAIGRAQESEANQFAANLLMPEKLIHAICRRDPGITPAELASRFRVSEKAMEIQLSNISPPQPFTQPSGKWRRSLRRRR